MEKAARVGLDVPAHRLFNGKYFGVERFDRKQNGEKVFMISASALLDADHKQPVLDYTDLLSLTAKHSFFISLPDTLLGTFIIYYVFGQKYNVFLPTHAIYESGYYFY